MRARIASGLLAMGASLPSVVPRSGSWGFRRRQCAMAPSVVPEVLDEWMRPFRCHFTAAVWRHGPVVVGLDDTIERRRGKRINAKGIYRDPVRSSRGHFVKASGLRWLCVMLLAPVPWAGCVWGLPFLTVPAPSERHAAASGIRFKKLTDWGRQALLQVARWLPDRRVVAVADSSFSVLEPLDAARRRVRVVTRLR